MLKRFMSWFRRPRKEGRPARMFNDFYQAWWFLYNHPIFDDTPKKMMLVEEPMPGTFSLFESCLDVDVVQVSPVTLRIEDYDEFNNKTQVWLECGPWVHKDRRRPKHERESYPEGSSHDPSLDCGGDTYEEAIVKLANLVFQHYDIAIWPWYFQTRNPDFVVNDPEPLLPDSEGSITLHKMF